MIYIDGSVALAQLLSENRIPAASFWREHLVSSRLLQYEVWNRAHAYGFTGSRLDDVRALLDLIDLTDMNRAVLARALEAFPIAVRTLDALHLATLASLRQAGAVAALASYDGRMLDAARALAIPIAPL